MNADKKEQELYRKFSESKQESVKLSAALDGFFTKNEYPQQGHQEEYRAYLRRRIRPAVEKLIEDEDVEKMQLLEEQGWFGEKELEVFLQTARVQKKTAALVWLLQLKDEKYGYKDRDFSL